MKVKAIINHGLEVGAVVDTAAQVTIISDRMFEQLDIKPPVRKKIVLQTAGRRMKIAGTE